MQSTVAPPDPARLRDNFRGWAQTASLADLATILDVIEDILIERRQPAAALVAQARTLLMRELAGR